MAASPDPRFALGIDFGTSHTTAILRWPDGHARPLLFDGSPLLPSAVYAQPGGRLIVGRDAVLAARREAARYEPTPKLRMDQASVLLGESEVTVPAMVAAVLGVVRDEAVRVSGAWPGELSVTITHPASWSAARRLVLIEAAGQADLPHPRLVPEPVAAAAYFVEVLGRTLAPGSTLVVYDLGGGTFEASVVARTNRGYEVLAVDGLDEAGGADLDAALLEHVIRTHGVADPQAWDRLEKPEATADRNHRRHLDESVRAAKETLSYAPSASVGVPQLGLEVTVTREEFEAAVRPVLDLTIRTTLAVIRSAELAYDQIIAVLLVGGSARVPLVATLMREAVGMSPISVEYPELILAEGSVQSGQNSPPRPEPVAPPTSPPPNQWPPTTSGAIVAPPAQRAPAGPSTPSTPSTADAPPAAAVPAAPGRPGSGPADPSLPAAELSPPADPWASEAELAFAAYVSATGGALVPLAPAAPTRAYGRATPYHVSSPNDDPVPARETGAPTPTAAHLVPTQRSAAPPVPAGSPATQPQASHRPEETRGPYLGTVVNTRPRATWLRVGLAVVGVIAVGAAGALAGPRFLAGGAEPNAGSGPGGPSGSSINGQAAGDPVNAATHAPYLRTATPSWLPRGWVKVVDDGPDGGAIIPGDATPLGTCTYERPGVFRVFRDGGDIAACRMRPYAKQARVRNGATEAKFALAHGCAALWMRTNTGSPDRRRPETGGYVAMACADGVVEVHELGDREPGPASRKAQWRATFDPANVVVGLLAQGDQLTVYVDGVRLGTVDEGTIPIGRLGVGGFAPGGGVDVTVTDLRAWNPA